MGSRRWPIGILELPTPSRRRDMREQVLDTMDLERERGITIKAQAVRVEWKGAQLNLIDTPGHVDFTYEVSRSLASCEGALLVVDAAQGIEAQTLANAYLAIENDLEIVPVVNKIDLPAAEPDAAASEIADLLGDDPERRAAHLRQDGRRASRRCSTRSSSACRRPRATPTRPLRALIFDSSYDRTAASSPSFASSTACFATARATACDGTRNTVRGRGARLLRHRRRSRSTRSGGRGRATSSPASRTSSTLRVGDTVTERRPAAEPLPGYKAKPMVFSGLFPTDADDYPELRDALERLKLNDAALTYEPETSQALGFGFRCGFLGLLHMEIVRERLEREFDLDLVVTAPNVEYRVKPPNGEWIEVHNAVRHARREIEEVEEPYVKASIIVPKEYVGALMELCNERRGRVRPHGVPRPRSACMLIYELPLAEIVLDFYDQLKSRTRGLRELDYELVGFRPPTSCSVDVLVDGEPGRRALADRPPRLGLRPRADAASKLREEIPRQLFDVRDPGRDRRAHHRPRNGEGEAQGRARQVLRRRHLAQAEAAREAEGGQEADEAGRQVEVPQEAFLAVLKLDSEKKS